MFIWLENGGVPLKVCIFADDTLTLLYGLENQFKSFLDIFQAFGKSSGCRLNLDKSKAFHIGSNISRNDNSMTHLGLNWPQHTVNYLDVTISIKPSKDRFELFQLNLYSYCDKLAPPLIL